MPDSNSPPITRRALVASAAGAIGGVVFGDMAAAGQANQGTVTPAPAVPNDPTAVPGLASGPLGARSKFESPALAPSGVVAGASFTPLHLLSGTITPSDLHFQRHHNGIAQIDPARYQLLVHGLVDRPIVFTLDELKRFPPVSRTHFIECAGNGRAAFRAPKREMTPQQTDGLVSNTEWTGVPLATLLREVGVRRGASWFLAEGGDAARMSRSVPIEKAMDDALIAYAQNGEPLRPANGYPVRLVLPGFEGNTSVKWLRRIELIDQPNMSRDETSKYTDPLPNETARQFSFVMDAKSVITSPAHPMRLSGAGWWPVSGVAWSGRGRITRVDVSADGARTWAAAELEEPVLPKAFTRFHMMWRWDGRPARLVSRAVDETGYEQPTVARFRDSRGAGTDYHFNALRAWDVDASGAVFLAVEP